MPRLKNPSLFQQVRFGDTLAAAWHQIYANGITSDFRPTRQGVSEFKEHEHTYLRRIRDQLQKKTYQFSPARGVLARKPNSKKSGQ